MVNPASYPTDELIKARMYQVQQEEANNPEGLFAQGVGQGIPQGVERYYKGQDENTKIRADMFKELLTKNVLMDKATKQPADFSTVYNVHQAFVKGDNDTINKLMSNLELHPINQGGGVYDPETKQLIPGLTSKDKPLPAAKPVVSAISPEDAETLGSNLAEGTISTVPMGMTNSQTRTNVLSNEAKKLREMEQSGGVASQRGGTKAKMSAMASAAQQGAKTQTTKVDLGINLVQALSNNYDPKTDTFTIPSSLHTEIALGFSRMLSPSGQVPYELMKDIRQGSAEESLKKTAIYFGYDPAQIGGTPQGIANFFAHQIVRQGQTAEELRNKYTGGGIGTSFNQTLKDSTLGNKFGGQQTGLGTQPAQGQGQRFQILEVK